MAEPFAEPAAEPGMGEEEDGIEVVLPPAGHLAEAWDKDPLIRRQMRDGKKLLAWTSRVTIGAANQASLVLNRAAIMIVIDVWGDICREPKSVPIRWVREEVKRLREMFTPQPDPVDVVVDQWGCKRLDARMQPMMDLMIQKWGATGELPVDAGPAPAAADAGEDAPPDVGDALIAPPPPAAYLVLAGLDSDDEGGLPSNRCLDDYPLCEDEPNQVLQSVPDKGDGTLLGVDSVPVPGSTSCEASLPDQVVQSIPDRGDGTLLGAHSVPEKASPQVVQSVPVAMDAVVAKNNAVQDKLARLQAIRLLVDIIMRLCAS
ncbi:unnamed protein product [Symbiodinium sp. CCMP2592]|nr:unnamed protein product [Symbiodinium sp. CCMP2592]